MIFGNAQPRNDTDELEVVNYDLVSFQNNLNIPTLFLDRALKIRHFTSAMTSLAGFKSSDIGRPLSHLSNMAITSGLMEDAKTTQERLTPVTMEIAIGNTWYIRTTQTYRIMDNHTKGIVVTFQDISLLKQAQQRAENARQAQALSEEKYRLFFTNAMNGIANHEIITDDTGNAIDYRYLEVNPAFERMTGQAAETVIGKTAREIFHGIENDPADWIGRYGRVALQGEKLRFEQHFALLDKWYDVVAFRTKTRQFCVVFNDITQRKISEQERERLITQLAHEKQVLADQAKFPEENPNPVLRITTAGVVLYANEASIPLLELWQCGIGDRIPDSLRHKIAEMEPRGTQTKLEIECRGRIFTLNVVAISQRGYINIYGNDITDRKLAEEALRRSQKDLTHAQEVGNIGSWRLDVRKNELTWSDENHRIFGIPKGVSLTYETFLSTIHPDDRAYVDTKWKAALEGSPYDIEHRIIVDGQVRWVREKAFLEFDTDKTLNGGFGITQDISERKQMEKQLQKRAEELANTNKELESFSYSISHDLRAPLRSIQGFCHFLKEDYADKLDTTAQDYLERIVDGSKKMNGLIEAMLDLSRIGRQEMIRQEVDLSSMAQSFIEELQHAQPQRIISVSIQENLKTLGDARLLYLAISNLIRNAWKFTGKTANPSITFGCQKKNGETVYFIRDNGAGFDSQMANKLFVPFLCLHSESEFPGTGIGLPIVERVIKRHGGRIWAEGQPNKGATFFFTLP